MPSKTTTDTADYAANVVAQVQEKIGVVWNRLSEQGRVHECRALLWSLMLNAPEHEHSFWRAVDSHLILNLIP